MGKKGWEEREREEGGGHPPSSFSPHTHAPSSVSHRTTVWCKRQYYEPLFFFFWLFILWGFFCLLLLFSFFFSFLFCFLHSGSALPPIVSAAHECLWAWDAGTRGCGSDRAKIRRCVCRWQFVSDTHIARAWCVAKGRKKRERERWGKGEGQLLPHIFFFNTDFFLWYRWFVAYDGACVCVCVCVCVCLLMSVQLSSMPTSRCTALSAVQRCDHTDPYECKGSGTGHPPPPGERGTARSIGSLFCILLPTHPPPPPFPRATGHQAISNKQTSCILLNGKKTHSKGAAQQGD